MQSNIFAAIAVASLFILSLIPSAVVADEQEKGELKAILVTGATTGIGRAIAERLASEGYFVYAGARKQADMDELNTLDNVEAVRLDVTVQEDIDAAVEQVRRGGSGLYGLVNNAGVYIGGPLIEVETSEFQWLMDVNVFGVYRVTQAFAPMIIESKGRVTTIGSTSGILSAPFSGQYSASKHAIEGYTDSLARELERFGVEVSVIEPGNYNSKIGETARKRILEKEYAQPGSRYADDLAKWLSGTWERSRYKEPDEVADAAMHALFAESPYRRYMVVPDEKEAALTIDKAVEELVQLNRWQAYSYSREELIEKLDAAIAEQHP